MDKTTTNISKTEAIRQLWEQGVLCEWFLDENQKTIRKFVDKCKAKQIAIVMGRQTGKTTFCLTYAIELCLNNPNYIVTMVAPAQNQARKIARIAMREIFDTCPPEIKPKYKTQENVFRFPNGSEIELYGNNNGKIEAARGTKSNLIIADETGFWTDMDYSIRSVLLPRLNSVKGGKLIVISTPPKSAGHPFQQFYETANYRKAAIIKNIFDCPRYTKEDIDGFAEELGGYDSIDFRREYLSEFIVDISMAIVPEANNEQLEKICKEWDTPPFYDTYVSMDLGFRDLTVILFAYYDFRNNKVVIQDELVFNTPEELRTDNLAYSIYDKEQELWGSEYHDEKFEAYLRVSDVNHFLLNDLYMQHGLLIQPTAKDDFDGGINNMRLMVGSERVIINPKCKTLIFHLKNGVWKNDKKKDFDRSPDAGHYDALAALMYLLRNIHYSKNPYPKNYDLTLGKNNNNLFISPKWQSNTSSIKEGLSEIFTLKSTKSKPYTNRKKRK